jgi:hypothetical protein
MVTVAITPDQDSVVGEIFIAALRKDLPAIFLSPPATPKAGSAFWDGCTAMPRKEKPSTRAVDAPPS